MVQNGENVKFRVKKKPVDYSNFRPLIVFEGPVKPGQGRSQGGRPG